jgi:hypothetical protein
MKHRYFNVIKIDNIKYFLRKKLKRLYIENFEKNIKDKKIGVLQTILKFKQYFDKLIMREQLDIEIGGHRFPLVQNVLYKTFFDFKNKELKNKIKNWHNLSELNEYTKPYDYSKMLAGIFLKEFGVGEVWGKRVKKSEILSVWAVYLEPSDALIYLSASDRIFLVEHYVLKNEVSVRDKIYSKQFREKLLLFIYGHEKTKGRLMYQRKKSKNVDRYMIGLLGWYPTKLEKDVIFKRGRRKKNGTKSDSED